MKAIAVSRLVHEIGRSENEPKWPEVRPECNAKRQNSAETSAGGSIARCAFCAVRCMQGAPIDRLHGAGETYPFMGSSIFQRGKVLRQAAVPAAEGRVDSQQSWFRVRAPRKCSLAGDPSQCAMILKESRESNPRDLATLILKREVL